jgi:hypothetical protein
VWPRLLAGQPADVRTTTQIRDSLELHTVAHTLTRGANSDSAKAAELYGWVAANVAYDVASYRRGEPGPAAPEAVYRARSAVCSGFVALYQRLAREIGVETAVIEGYAKGFDYVYGRSTRKPNHAWLAVRIDGNWRLVDPTWGAGTINNGRFVRQVTWDYVLADPDKLLLSHHPKDGGWQLTGDPMKRSEFERLPAVPRALLALGFTPEEIRAAAVASRLNVLPAAGPVAGVRIVDAPISGTIRRLAAVPVRVEWPGASDVVVVSGDVWTPLARSGDTFHGEATADGGALYIVGRARPGDPYRTLLMYQVN